MMNRIQTLSQHIEAERLKLQMGLSADIDIDTLTLRAMWRQLCAERSDLKRRLRAGDMLPAPAGP
jgi:hypothetical protein